MLVSSLSWLLTSSIFRRKLNFSITTALGFTTSTSADSYWAHLQKDGSNVEKSLNAVRTELDVSTIIEVLRRCVLSQQHILGLRFFIWSGFQPNYRHSRYVYSQACELFDVKKNPRVISDVIEVYRVDGCFVSLKTFKVILNLCREAGLAEEGFWILGQMKEFNCQPDMTMYNVVIRLFCSRGVMDTAAELMREMGLVGLYPDMTTYTAMIKGFCDVGRLEDACGLFVVMREHGCRPSAVAYSALLDGICTHGSMDRALKLLEGMEKEGGDCSPNVVTYTSVIQRFCEKGKPMEALAILDRMEAQGCHPNRVTVVPLIQGLCAKGRQEEAYKLIAKVVAGGSVSDGECYSSFVLALLRMRRIEDAEKLFRQMLVTTVKPDGLASSMMIRNLCLEGRVLDGLYLYNEIEKLGFLSSIDSDIYSLLLAGLCKESHLVEASKFAKLMAEKGIHLKGPYAHYIVEHLKNSGEKDLVSFLTSNEG